MDNNLKSSKTGLLNNHGDPLESLWKNELKKEAKKVVVKQGRFGAVDDDEYIGSATSK